MLIDANEVLIKEARVYIVYILLRAREVGSTAKTTPSGPVTDTLV